MVQRSINLGSKFPQTVFVPMIQKMRNVVPTDPFWVFVVQISVHVKESVADKENQVDIVLVFSV